MERPSINLLKILICIIDILCSLRRAYVVTTHEL
jgi:hypothetical protein